MRYARWAPGIPDSSSEAAATFLSTKAEAEAEAEQFCWKNFRPLQAKDQESRTRGLA